MSVRPLTLERTDERTLSYVERVLEANGLPSRDVRSKPECFYVGYVGDERVGIGGIEPCGADGLLRSVVVERSERGNGFGAAICDGLERTARDDGLEALYLLTTTAAEFFASRGYAETERATVPAAIRRTAEFDELCPTTATCMKKSL